MFFFILNKTNLTLWGSHANEFDPELHKAVVVFGGKVKVFQGKRLVGCTERTTVKVFAY